MLLSTFCLVNILWLCATMRATRSRNYDANDSDSYCPELTEEALIVVLGQAFNPRYMSISYPQLNADASKYGSGSAGGGSGGSGGKRSSNDIPFYADKDIISVGNHPAWETSHVSFFELQERDVTRALHKRNTHVETTEDGMTRARPWECFSRIRWVDLGKNYFPRYIRSVECTSNRCWYGHFHCKPKSFTVKVLRRKVGACVRVSEKLVMLATVTAEQDFTELWIWEEIVVNFCCDCVMVY